jgi:hypothetical protein
LLEIFLMNFPFRSLIAIAAVAGLAGCTTLRAPEPALDVRTERSVQEVSSLLDGQATSCWRTRVTPLSSGLGVQSLSRYDGGITVLAYRINWSAGVRTPFLTMDILDEGGKARVKVAEGDFYCNPLTVSCSKLGLTDHVRRWLDGELQCFGDAVPFGI